MNLYDDFFQNISKINIFNMKHSNPELVVLAPDHIYS